MTDGAKDKALADMGVLCSQHKSLEEALRYIEPMVQHILDYDSRNTSRAEVRRFCEKQLRLLYFPNPNPR